MPNLVGIGNSQVPTNAMLGGLAYQDSVGEINIDKIKAKTSDTAVDIFVYDTRKDSDGGAWRHRTQNKSWYNEGASATRGARKEFPTVAVIVVENNGAYNPAITIYDGDDPNLSMWMVVHTRNAGGGDDQRTSEKFYAAGPYPIRKVVMLNGIMVDCQFRSAGHAAGTVKGVTRYNFITDSSIMITDEGTFKRNGNLGDERNTERSYTKLSTTNIVHTQCNDVAMTVLPNAPIDASTGLPIPTIAVATDGGISIIRDTVANSPIDGVSAINEVVVDMSISNASTQPAKEIYFTESNKLAFTHGANWVYYYEIPSSDTTSTYWNGLANFIGRFTDKQRDWATNGIPINVGNDGITNFIEDRAIGHTNGVDLVDIRTGMASTTMGFGMHCGIATNFNTGWMHGDSKAAFLSDTDDTNITSSSQRVVNGDFDTDTSSWTYTGSGSATHGSGQVTVTGAVGDRIYQDITGLEVGKTYVLSGDIVSGTNGQISLYQNAHASSGAFIVGSGNVSPQTVNLVFTAPSTTANLRLVRVSSTVVYDNISLRKGDFNRSIGGKPKVYGIGSNALEAIGTITKEPVATGAELVSYGPFSTVNRLRQPYNSDLTFGTSDFSIMFWVNHDGTDAHQTIVGRDEREFNIFLLSKSSYSRKIRCYAHDSSDTVQSVDSTAYPYPINSWAHICVNYTGGNTVSIYVDGVLNNSGNLNYDIDNTTYALHVGVRNAAANSGISFAAANCKLALLRISKSAPSAGQVKKIYDDEKCLFHENAKCSLHGTSNAVVTLAHDDTNDVIHSGTSSGRSDFRGLNRINNTTTAVTTVISASNELVAEQ